MLLHKRDPGDGWLLHKSFCDQGERGMVFLGFRQLGLQKLMLPSNAQVNWSIASDGVCKSNLALGLEMSVTADFTVLICFVSAIFSSYVFSLTRELMK